MYFYFGIHKASTTWLIGILYEVNKLIGLKHSHFHSKKHFQYDLPKIITNQSLDFVSYTISEYDTVNSISFPFKGFHVIRDPRDIIVSSYFSHLHSHSDEMWPEVNEYRQELESLNKEDGIIATIRHLDKLSVDGEIIRTFDCLKTWNYENPNILEVKFEDLTQNPYIIIPEIFDFLGLLANEEIAPYNSIKKRFNDLIKVLEFRVNKSSQRLIYLPELLQILYKHDFYFKSKGRKKGAANEKSHYRNGVPNDWKNHLTASSIKLIKENYGDLLIKLGYEQNLDW